MIVPWIWPPATDSSSGPIGPISSDDVTNASGVPGDTVTDALNALDAPITSDDVGNASGVPGATVSDALDALNVPVTSNDVSNASTVTGATVTAALDTLKTSISAGDAQSIWYHRPADVIEEYSGVDLLTQPGWQARRVQGGTNIAVNTLVGPVDWVTPGASALLAPNEYRFSLIDGWAYYQMKPAVGVDTLLVRPYPALGGTLVAFVDAQGFIKSASRTSIWMGNNVTTLTNPSTEPYFETGLGPAGGFPPPNYTFFKHVPGVDLSSVDGLAEYADMLMIARQNSSNTQPAIGMSSRQLHVANSNYTGHAATVPQFYGFRFGFTFTNAGMPGSDVFGFRVIRLRPMNTWLELE